MLKTDYIDPEWEGDLLYVVTTNTDGTISLTDATTYINSGDYIQALDINTTNTEINRFANLYKTWIGGSFTPLKTNYVDSEWDGRKLYRETDNGDGTVGLTDVTQYDVVGTEYEASDINTANTLLNAFTNGYDSGIASITARLQALGVTDTSDLIRAIDTMANVQNQNGVNQGKADVTSNPNSYGLYTQAQYTSATQSADGKAAKIRSAASAITSCATNSTYMTSDMANINNKTKTARQLANTIVKGMNAAAAMTARSNCLTGAQGIYSASSYTNYSNDINNALSILRS